MVRSLTLPITPAPCSWASLMPMPGWRFHQLQQVHRQVQPDVAFRDHEPRQHALGVLFALPFRLLTDQRHDHQFVVAPVRAAHQPPAPTVDARLVPAPAQQARPPSCGFGHRRQVCLKVQPCKFRMSQFFWWGSPRTWAEVPGGGPYLSLQSPESLPGETYPTPLAGLYQSRHSHLACNSTNLAISKPNCIRSRAFEAKRRLRSYQNNVALMSPIRDDLTAR